MKTNPKFISILSDYGFKVTFADESDTLFLRTSLQALIQSRYAIQKVNFLRNEFEGQTKDSRSGIYDLICEDETGSTFIVEMQLGYFKNYIQRAKFYAFQKFNTFIRKGNYFYNDIPRIYCIGFLARNIFPESEHYYHFATLKNQDGEELDHQITHIIVEISKFNLSLDDIQSNLDKLLYIMKNADKLKKNSDFPSFLTEDWLEKALKRLDEGNMTPDQRMFYNMAIAKNASIIQMEQEERREAVEQGIKEGIEKAVEEAVEKAVEEAVEKAVEKAVEEAVEKAVEEAVEETVKKERAVFLATAKKLKERNMPLQEISAITGLSIDELEKL